MQKKSLIIFFICIIILLIVALVCIFKKEKNDRLINLYNKIRSIQNFTFSMEEQNQEFKYKVSMSQRGTDVSIDMYSDDEHTTTLVLEKETYFIMHDNKEYYNYGNEDVDSDIILSGLNNITKNAYTTGKEDVYGKEYYYEEFLNENSDFIIFADVNEESTVKTRFYFDGDNLVFIKNIVINEDNSQEEKIKTNLEFTIDEKSFVLPDNYAEVED